MSGGGQRGPLRPLSVAPMMDRTDRHYRWLVRRITRCTLLYTEMVTTGAILHRDRDRLLGFSPQERPLALQLGGDDPSALAECARIAEDRGYDEVNLNVGCPSDRVQRGSFGVCLMGEPDRVATAVAAMRAATSLPVTVKHRIGFDDRDRYEDMAGFVRTVAAAGCDRFVVHARKAWLQGLSPKQNREVPPLRYEDVHRLKAEHPELRIEINGGIRALDDVTAHLAHVDGVMIGRAAYDDPWMLSEADRVVYGDARAVPDRIAVARAAIPYLESVVAGGGKPTAVTRHLLSLFRGRPGGRAWRRELSEGSLREDAGAETVEVVERALARVEATAEV